MKKTDPIAVAAIVVAVLVALATPAAAGGPYSLEVGGGTLSTALGQFDLGPGEGGTPPCPSNGTVFELSTDADSVFASPGTWSATGSYSGQFELPAGSDTWYKADLEILFGSGGTYTGPGPYTLDGLIGAQVVLHHIGSVSDPDCGKDDPVCVITGLFQITDGDYVGTLPNAGVGDTMTIDGDTVSSGFPVVASACAPPFSAVNGTDATMDDLLLTVVS